MEYEIIIDRDGVEHILINNGNNEFTSMPKTLWDEIEKNKEVNTIL